MAEREVSVEIRSGLFMERTGSGVLTLSDAVGFTAGEFARARARLVLRIGDARGIAGLAAATGEPRYVPDCGEEPQWLGATEKIRSAYFVPARDLEGRSRVVVLLSPMKDGITAAERRIADLLVPFLARRDEASGLGGLSQKIEQCFAGISMLLAGQRREDSDVPAGFSREVLQRIESLTPRERDIFDRLRRGDRVATISRELFISPHTVRNHLKAVFRKFGVRSQAELMEAARPESRHAADRSDGLATTGRHSDE